MEAVPKGVTGAGRLGCLLVVGFVLLCCGGIYKAALDGQNARWLPAESTGESCTLSLDSGAELVLGVTHEDANELSKLMNARDSVGVIKMIGDGRAFAVDSGTSAKVIETGVFLNRVRIESGPMFGQDGWIAPEFCR